MISISFDACMIVANLMKCSETVVWAANVGIRFIGLCFGSHWKYASNESQEIPHSHLDSLAR